MANRTGPTNIHLRNLIRELRKLSTKNNVKLWKRIAYELERSTRNKREVNLTKIDRYTKENEIALVPGKVLGTGDLTKKITVAAFKFSEKSKEIINKKGKAISIQELMKDNPKGKKVRIIG
ncbi:MAG: 50S ribosomal protein L18e [Candidatus Woesearchaeota archaeon]|nr:50S ribosomal protein L18e [Candidatus Woesearchaeota archaeon]